MPRRKSHISLTEKLAAALRHMKVEQDGQLVDAIPYDDAKRMSSEDVISLFHFDHGIHESVDGPTEHWNLTPRLIAEHRRKTAEVDLPQIAKTKRIAAEHEAFRDRLLAKRNRGDDVPKTAPKGRLKGAPLRSRGFQAPPPGTVFDWKTKRYVRPDDGREV